MMRILRFTWNDLRTFSLGLMLLTQHLLNAQADFVLVKGGVFQTKVQSLSTDSVCIRDFEIMDHPVTNSEYQRFVLATGHPPPLHWTNGDYPSGTGNHPVIFVNRYDAQAYLDWRSQREGRIYRFPTVHEFEIASRGGFEDLRYPGGNEMSIDVANYDELGTRSYSNWEDALQQAKYGKANGYGLYGMGGNVFQMCLDNFDPAITKWKYRVHTPAELERAVMGGSWARDKSYMQIGYRLGISPGLRLPDLGFRPVRSPVGTDWHPINRKLVAVTKGAGSVSLSWAILKSDVETVGFNIYRSDSRGHDGFKINREVVQQPYFVDGTVQQDSRYYYYVQAVDASGKEGNRSTWTGVTVRGPVGQYTTFKPIHQSKSLVPVFGDLDGDGALDCVIRMDNGNVEMSQDPGRQVQLEAFTSYGRSLWRKNLSNHRSCYGNANNVPFCLWDMDGDGKAEVITRIALNDTSYVALLNGLSGDIVHKTKWPDLVSDFARSSTRIHMSIAYLDGKRPFVITQTGLYENEVITAYDHDLQKVWEFHSLAETSGSGSHRIEIADVNGDGRQEVFDGTTCLNADGTLRWSIYRGHPDIVSINDFVPGRSGLEVYFMVETSVHAGIYMVDADDGEVIWKINREDDPRWLHGHHGWTSDIWEGKPGIECVANRAGHSDHHMLLYAADGEFLQDGFPYGYTPLEWDGDETRELVNHRMIGEYDGHEIVPLSRISPDFPKGSKLLMTADLVGDARDELVFLIEPEGQPSFVSIHVASHAMEEWYLAPSESLDYRLWLARNMGGGYKSVFTHQLQRLD